jgi:hypothetical protein
MNEEMQTISHKTSITRFGLTCQPNWVSDKDTSVSDFKRIKSDNCLYKPAWRKLAGSELLRRLRHDRCMILYGLRMIDQQLDEPIDESEADLESAFLGASPIQRAILPPQPRNVRQA